MTDVPPIVITGRGAVSGFGYGVSALQQGMAAGVSSARPVRRFATDAFPVNIAACVPGTDSMFMPEQPSEVSAQLTKRYAVAAGREALAEAGLAGGPRLGLVMGSNVEDRPVRLSELMGSIADALGCGPRVLVSTACASSTSAVELALDWLSQGELEAVLVGGSDVVTPRLFAGFQVLGAMASRPCTPFGDQLGLTLGEGAGFVVLERADRAAQRGARVWGEVAGAATRADAHHLTQPDPAGLGVAGAVTAALRDAAIAPEQVVMVNAHGTATEANDVAEVKGLSRAFGGLDHTPVSSSKHLIGHAQGAAGMLEFLVTLIAADANAIPPTWGTQALRAGAPPDPVLGALREAPDGPRVCSNSGFGGVNAAVVLGRRGRGRPRRDVYFAASASLAQAEGVALDRRTLGKWERRVDPRLANPVTALMVGAARRVARKLEGEVGLAAAQLEGSQRSVDELSRSIERGGLMRLHSGAFTRTLMVAAAGQAAIELKLTGPLTVLCSGRVSGLLAVGYAFDRVAGGVDAMVAAAADEGDWSGTAALGLSATPHPVRMAGWRVAGTSEALRSAVAPLLEGLAEVRWSGEPAWSAVTATEGVYRAAAGVEQLSDPDVDAVVVHGMDRGIAVAVVWVRA